MGVYIKGMEMPKKGCIKMLVLLCDGKVIETTSGCQPQPEEQNYKAVPVPPHYDLIDHNALKIAVMDCDAETRIDFLKHAMDCINKAPVVIPSDMQTYEEKEDE